MSKTIIVSNRLPVRIEREGDELSYQPSEGGLATGLGSIYKEGNNIWIGWPGASFDDENLRDEVTEGLKKENMRPVFLTEEEIEEFYLGFSNQTLWPACHYFVQYIDYDQQNWESYKRVNQKFADVIAQNLEPGDIIWVHDYQLMLVPQLLRQELPDITVGFFQHIPFPSYEVFRTLPWRRELLEGMLGSDYIAFHTYDDMRHFLSSVHRLVGLPYEGSQVQLEDRLVSVDSLPMGIDYEKYAQNAEHPEAVERESRYRNSLGPQRLILSMDRLDYSKGITRRLEAFDKFLEVHSEYREKVSLLLIVVPSRDKVPNYKELKEQVDELVGKINSKYGRMSWTPIHYFYRSYPFRALGAFYRMCDVAMITPLRDGMNLVCKEYIASRTEGDGVLILSEMAGSSKELADAILVNPNDQNQLVASIKEALEMPFEEQKLHMNAMKKTIAKYDIFNWVKLFFDNLEEARKQRDHMNTLQLEGKRREELKKAYQTGESRLLLLDYDGTLVEFNKDPEACAPDSDLKNLLTQLANDPKNQVVVISGRRKETLGNWLSELPVNLVAEHGIWTKLKGRDWERDSKIDDSTWKDEAREIMEFYVDRTPGSFVEEKSYALAWHYRKVEKGLGEVRMSELRSHLKHMMSGKHCQVLDGDYVIELKPDSVNKGQVALEYYKERKSGFNLCIGDDVTDESMFEVLPEDVFTIRVGGGKSSARYALKSVSDTRKLLNSLVRES
jgi:trehalose 6-phosphate synthase/phosphatase